MPIGRKVTPLHVVPSSAPSWSSEPTEAAPGDRPLRPREDPFYVAPEGFEALAPGTVIRIREVRLGLLGLIPQKVRAWQLLFRTCDLDGAAEAAVTTVLLPSRTDRRRPPRLVAYQCAIDAVADKCFPSYALRAGARSLGSFTQLELLLIAGILARGYVVSVADHEGLGGAFAAPREPGYRVLDGVRAAQSFEPLGLAPQTKVGIMGYSGGGMASSWVAEMAPTYAPEIDIVGAALGAPVGDPGQTFIRLNGTFFAGLPALVVSGLRHVYPGLAAVVHEHANFDGRRRLKALEDASTVGAILGYRGDDFDHYLDAPLADVLATPEVLHVFEDLRLGHHRPDCPLLVVHGVHDQIIHVDDVDGQVARYVEGGAHVRYVRDRCSEHLLLLPIAMPMMLGWIDDRFEGRPAPEGTATVLSVALSPRAVLGYLGMAAAAVRTVLGRPL